MLKNENLNRLAYLESLCKKPFEMLLELIEIECFKYDFSEKRAVSLSGKNMVDVFRKQYNLSISEEILNRLISNNFELKDKKLVLKNEDLEDISTKITNIKVDEEEFLKDVNSVKKSFIDFSLNKFNKKIDKELARKIFDSYIYSAANSIILNTKDDVESENYFIFKEFLKELLNSDISKLNIIENFGIANQIQDLVIHDNVDDKRFLDGCQIFLDTPILMKWLGYDGKSLHDEYSKLLELMRNAGAELHVFDHTLEETWGILFNFKRSIALNILDAKGVDAFLKARKEFENEAESIIPLDKDSLKSNILNLGISIEQTYTEESLSSSFEDWNFDEKRFIEILKKCSGAISEEYYRSWIEKDTASISAIHRLRAREKIKTTTDYKSGKYYLLIDNYVLIDALKEYYKQESFSPKKNELLLENSLLFQLWQQFSDNGDISRSMFRSKCFAMNVIDDSFKEKLYKTVRRLEAYESDLNIAEGIIDNPDVQDAVYADAIKDDKVLDEQYIASTLKNKVSSEKKSLRETIKNKNNEIKTLERQSKEKDSIHAKEKESAVAEVRQETQNNDIKCLALSLRKKKLEKVKIFFIKIFNKEFDENKYFIEKAKKLLQG